MTKVIVYLGPSLSIDKARAILDADYRPPVRRGDLKKALEDGAGIIGIIDGAFYSDSPVGHKEIIAVMKKGVVVVGGSSMGALRASELDVFGMIGVGRIYECYRSGRLVADDEVAVTYNPLTGEQISEPLVNVRYQLKAAELDGVITGEEKSALISMVAGMYYPDRVYPAILKLAVEKNILSAKKAADLLRYIEEKPLSLKAEDAIATLKKIKELSSLTSLKSR
ncbi:TfuA-related McrA-glycine thioamidation protein [Methanocella conradii]|uniref:TfuA-related McrA-glycine thioamidation protein n=1 Tax=Methanocella conradii TaxID=1175444 RepID=UPI0024B3C5EB|nr:TfuA-related McrA-glycine thioamidation protein [Methanocella conradii]MDI6896563.1 TfuA-related McrA-glycine thioamidation protein [Methanocella conradii]